MDQTMSRRSALKTTTLSAPVAAQTDPRVVVVHTDDLAAESRRLRAEYEERRDASEAAYDAIASTLSSEQGRLLMAYADRANDVDSIFGELMVSELARHFPGV